MPDTLSKRTHWILPFDHPTATSLPVAGGKGANLARLSQAGFPVPGRFLLTTQAYTDFIAANDLARRILAALPVGKGDDPAQLEAASERIHQLFSSGKLPAGLLDALRAAYAGLGAPPVAVRSSATAEDLPDISFAGQQDTYLNVLGEDALLKAIVECWASLWTARAIGYRMRNDVSQAGVALAVAVQRMVESQVSGVLFTANPLTGLRTETVIDATFGLGEALVSGRVEPDNYLVDSARRKILAKKLGAKALSIHGKVTGGTSLVEQPRGAEQALPDEQILTLAEIGQRVAAMYGSPQDIEWAWSEGRLWLLQSRPITSLFPTPSGMPPEPLRVLFSFGAVQGLLDPMTPLGMEILKVAFSMGASLFGIRPDLRAPGVLRIAGERLWVDITTLIRNTVGRRVIRVALSMVEPSVNQAVGLILDDPRLVPERNGIRPKALRQILRFLLPFGWNMFLNILSPRQRRKIIVESGEQVLDDMTARLGAIQGDAYARLGQVADALPRLASENLHKTLLRFVSLVAAAMASFNALRVLGNQLPDTVTGGSSSGWPLLVLETTRGLPNNPTTEMDLALWAVARKINSDPELRAEFLTHPVPDLVARYRSGAMPEAARSLIRNFLERYGGRGLAEIDVGRQRWFEEPAHIFEVLSGYLQIEQSSLAPDAVFSRGAESAQLAVERLANALRMTRLGWLKARLARFFASRVRDMLGARESPKFFAVRLFGLLRCELLETGSELVEDGAIDQPGDLFYLTFSELKLLSAREPRDWKELVHTRRFAYSREMLRRQVPRLLLSDGRAFYEGIHARPDSGASLTGSPVSPGSIEGRVRVVFDPRQANLQPGEILVCPGTDPSWTPLFLTAAGLVMEVGGMMTHGAVVAREYGIPAVVGVDRATQILATGQRIRLDGSTGQIDLLEA